jgi:hypothetical protein
MENAMILSRVNAALPTLMKIFSYDEFDRMFQTPAYVTDRAAYYQGARVSDKIAVVFNLANGYCYRFLNGVKIYGGDGQGRTKLLAEMSFPMYQGAYWSESTGRQVAENLLTSYIQDQCVVLGIPRPSQEQARQVASTMVGETLLVTEKIGRQITAGNQPIAIAG